MSADERSNRFKYQHIYDELHRLVTGGRFRSGDRLPTEVELSERFGVSRPTVTRALNTLQDEGLITRRTGSGSYVAHTHSEKRENRLFGLLIPGLGKGEIFEPICTQIAERAEQNDFSLLWSGIHIRTEEATNALVDVAQRYIDNNVAGVFFEPLELSPSFDAINRNLVEMLSEAGIPIVLIDSDYVPFPQRSTFDLVGIDNFRSGYLVTEHYLRRGVDRVDFLARPYSAYTVSIRLRGYRSALLDYGIEPNPDWVHFGNPEDKPFVDAHLLKSGARNLVCANDETAAALMHQLEERQVHIPEELCIVGFDDIRYASMLRIPLTTLHQPVQEIGNLALGTMLWRLEHPDALARTVTLSGNLVVRQSCGAGES
ncbi:MAG: GntR family transcriptional regulator [Spirochaeta sp.]|nr:GntR family transcriptional regulator [Spirochaeta sp.]